MSSTIWRADSLAPVISLTAARGDSGVGDTLMVRCSLVSDDSVYRWVGIHEHSLIDESRLTIATIFALNRLDSTQPVMAAADGSLELRDVLRNCGDSTTFTWGLWQFDMQLADIYHRDASTPPSVCVAGAGTFGGQPFDIREINAQLIGVERAKELEELVRDDAREIISRATTHDFLPLIQALGVERDTGASANAPLLAGLPVEAEPKARDAFWATVLARACCADEPTTAWLAESIMSSLGWEDMAAGDICALCADSLAQLDNVTADLPLSERLDVYRELLRG